MLGSLMLVPLMRFVARKVVLCLSSAVMGVSLLLLGLCSYSHHHNIDLIKDCDWLPLTCSVSYILATNMGHSALPNIFISEFYPSHVSFIFALNLQYNIYGYRLHAYNLNMDYKSKRSSIL